MQTGALTPDNATPGRILAAARTERGMSVPEVAQRLKFSLRHIEALESDRYDALPGGPYVRGMIRTYARLLGVDPASLLDALPRSGETGEPAMQPQGMSVPFPQGPGSGSRVYLLLSMLIVVAVVVVLAEWLIRSQRAVVPEAAVSSSTAEPPAKVEPLPEPVLSTAETGASAPQPETQETEPPAVSEATPEPPASEIRVTVSPPEVESTASVVVAESPTVERAAVIQPSAAAVDPVPAQASEPLVPGAALLSFTFEVESWIEVRDASGEIIVSALNSAGTAREVRGTAPFTMVIGNASGVRLTYDGKPVELTPHRTSDVARLTLE